MTQNRESPDVLVVRIPGFHYCDQVQPLGGEDPLEKGTASHSSILAWRIPGIEEPGGL